MASHHQVSPQASLHPQHRQPAAQVQPNGHAQYTQQRQNNSGQMLMSINESTWIKIGKMSEAMNLNEAAITAFDRAIHFNPYSTEALRNIANVLKSEEKYTEAVEYYDSILKLDPNSGECWSNLGHCYLMMDKLQEAYQAYQHALYNLANPREPKLWYGIGILYDRYGSLDHAEGAFAQVMDMAPTFEKANEIYFRLGIIYKQQNKYPQSLECFQYIATNPPAPLNQTDIWFQIGHVHEQQGDFESAKAAYRKVLERDSRHAKVLQQLGWLFHQESNDHKVQDEAIDYLEQSVASDQNDAQSWYLLGRCYMAQTKYPKAYEAYQQAVYRDGRNPTFWCSIGVLYYQINQYRDALDAYSRAIRLNPQISEVWYDLGTLYQSCNNQTSDALDAYQRAAELDPHNPHIKSRLEQLRASLANGHSPQGGPPGYDNNPQTYEPAAMNGPPPPQWQPTLSAPANHARGGAHQPPPPPPPSAPASQLTRETWGARPGEPQHAPPAPPPGAAPINAYEPRDIRAGPPAPPQGRTHSPRMEAIRLDDRHRHTPSRRPVSPSPRMQNSMPQPPYRTPQTVPAGPPPGPSALPPHQQPPPPNRMSNPNYGAQPPPPGPNAPPLSQHGPPPPYGRPNTPPTARGGPEPRPRSPRSGYPAHFQEPHHVFHDPRAESAGHNSLPPQSGYRQSDAAARDREESHSISAKRQREWEEREERETRHKRNANDESRARLDDPHVAKRPSPPPMRHSYENERSDREIERGHVKAQQESLRHGDGSSSENARRPEPHQMADESYRPSEHAHHLPPVAPATEQTLPPSAKAPAEHVNGSSKGEQASKLDEGQVKIETSQQTSEEARPAPVPTKDRDGDTQMAVEEPAARKMIVDENYDEASDEDSARATGKSEGKSVATTQPPGPPEEGDAPKAQSTEKSDGNASTKAEA